MSTANMNLDLPVVSSTIGPDWATELNAAITTIDAHDHTTDKGSRVPVAGININDALDINSQNVDSARSYRVDDQVSALVLAADVRGIYAVAGDLYWNNNAGTAVQITDGSSLSLASIGGIGGDYSTSNATITYSDTTKVYTFLQEAGIAGKMAVGPTSIYEDVSGGKAVTLQVPASLGANYTWTFPTALPGADRYLGVSSAGVITNETADAIAADMTATGADSIVALFDAGNADTIVGLMDADNGDDIQQLARYHGEATVKNIGINLASGVFKIVGADGSTDLSASNIGEIIMQSTTDGGLVKLQATAATHLLQDASHATDSDVIGEYWSMTTLIAWDQDRPMFLYACNADDTSANLKFFWSFDPTLTKSPVTASIAYADTVMSTHTDSGAFFMTTTDVTSSHDEKPCLLIGGFRVRMDASDDITVQTLDQDKGDGIRKDPFKGKWFQFPRTGQMGAGGATDWLFDSTEAPQWTNQSTMQYLYKLNPDGTCDINLTTTNSGTRSANGTDSNSCRIIAPYDINTSFITSNAFIFGGAGRYKATGNSLPQGTLMSAFDSDNGDATLSILSYDSTIVQNNEFTSTNDEIDVKLTFPAFGQTV